MYRGYPGVDHIGPPAQDSAAAFGLGAKTTSVATRAIAGVALPSIQALVAENPELKAGSTSWSSASPNSKPASTSD